MWNPEQGQGPEEPLCSHVCRRQQKEHDSVIEHISNHSVKTTHGDFAVISHPAANWHSQYIQLEPLWLLEVWQPPCGYHNMAVCVEKREKLTGRLSD